MREKDEKGPEEDAPVILAASEIGYVRTGMRVYSPVLIDHCPTDTTRMKKLKFVLVFYLWFSVYFHRNPPCSSSEAGREAVFGWPLLFLWSVCEYVRLH